VRNDGTAWQVIIVEPCLSWLHELRRSDRQTLVQISQAIAVLGWPLVDTVSGAKLPNLLELRPGSAGDSEVRLLFVFDPQRRAMFLVGGDKSGKWSDWYKTAIPRAEGAYAEHLRIEGNK
jgi:hypothetical protein